jgi:uncharacterized protein (DUF488 family)
MSDITLYTIGFTQKSAEAFFAILVNAGVRRVIDIRLKNASQLAGFAKKDDLAWFCKTIGAIDYIHCPACAPEKGLFDEYKKKSIGWEAFEKRFLSLITERKIEATLDRQTLAQACLLCSEPRPDNCHRRLVAEYLQHKKGGIRICHL